MMFPRVSLLLIGAVFIYYQVNAEDSYFSYLLVKSNVTLMSQTILSSLTNQIKVNDTNGTFHTVSILKKELVGECLLIGDESSCNCTAGYAWSNEACYSVSCCNETTCKTKVSDITPLCVAKSRVYINGSATPKLSTWDSYQTKFFQVHAAFQKLNAFGSLNVTSVSLSKLEFEADVSVPLRTSKLQELVNEAQTSLSAVIFVDTVGMVEITSPNVSVRYKSSPELKCTLEEATHSAGWNMSRTHERFELKDGSVVQLNNSCATQENTSCVELVLQNVTGDFSGIYECGFRIGSIRHTAKAELKVALLPDEIIMQSDPPTGDCSESSEVFVNVSATIANTPETFEVSWTSQFLKLSDNSTTATEDVLVYSVKAQVVCQKMTEGQSVAITFKNKLGQTETEQVDIPVIYEGAKFCSADGMWPKTPDGSTVQTACEPNKTGYKARTCEGSTWQPVFLDCISLQMKKVETAAENFQKGLGATQEVAMDIFEGLENTTTVSYSDDSLAETRASIQVFGLMGKATKKNKLTDAVIPNFFSVASKVLNNSWQQDNSSVRHRMSSSYLSSVEDLVRNIEMNSSTVSYGHRNLDLKISPGSDKSVCTFGVNVTLNGNGTGMVKTVAVKNLMSKLKNNFKNTEPVNDLVIIATLADNASHSPMEITMNFPVDPLRTEEQFCVFWDTTLGDWSDRGCTVERSTGNHTICNCTHLTSFSVLMSKGSSPNPVLEMITYVGLGVSIVSLLVLLIVEYLVWSVVVKTSLSHFRHTAMVNIATFLLLADCSFLASSNPQILRPTWCLILTICKHLFFLAMFSWMLCLSVMLVHQLIFVFSPLRKRVFMLLSSIVGYACPILIVGSSYVYCKYTDMPYHDNETCWLKYVKLLEGSLHAFLLPVGTVIFINIFSMAVVIFTLLRTSVPDNSKENQRETTKSIIKVVICLTPVFGVTWGIGFFQQIAPSDDPLQAVAEYLFTILNSFQGLFVMLTGCFSEPKVREQLLKLVGKGNNTSMNSTATTYTKDK